MTRIGVAVRAKKSSKYKDLDLLLKVFSLFVILLSGGFAGAAFGQASDAGAKSAWVTDEFEITMRNGKSNRQSIVRMLPSGTKVTVIERDNEAGYSLVRSRSGAEGWVLNRYLLSRPPARVTLPDLQAQLARIEEKRKEQSGELRKLGAENAALKRQLGQSENSGEGLERELGRIKSLSSRTVQIDAENRQLKESLGQTEQALEEARDENRRLASRSNREWFIIGALVVMFGIVVGLILPRIRWRKKSSWGEL